MDNVLHVYFSEGCSVRTCYTVIETIATNDEDIVETLTEMSF